MFINGENETDTNQALWVGVLSNAQQTSLLSLPTHVLNEELIKTIE